MEKVGPVRLRSAINHAAAVAVSMVAGYVARIFAAVLSVIGLGFAAPALCLLLVAPAP
jgi:hypothetical protein